MWLILGGGTIYLGTLFSTLRYFNNMKPKVENNIIDPTKEERLNVVNQIATVYDKEVAKNTTEWLIGIQKQRKKILANAKGRTLEIAGGTGKNLQYYTENCDELVFVDSSEMMLQMAVWKYRKLNQDAKIQMKSNTKINFQLMDAEKLTFPDRSFDTIVDTYGVCSFNDPVQAVKEMGRVCKTDGKILLLEHGRSNSFSWLNKYLLDKYQLEHTWKYGCTWNRDITKIVTDAGLNIETEKRVHFGTNVFIIATPKIQNNEIEPSTSNE